MVSWVDRSRVNECGIQAVGFAPKAGHRGRPGSGHRVNAGNSCRHPHSSQLRRRPGRSLGPRRRPHRLAAHSGIRQRYRRRAELRQILPWSGGLLARLELFLRRRSGFGPRFGREVELRVEHGLKLGRVPCPLDRHHHSGMRCLMHRHPAEHGYLEDHQRPADQLEQSQQVQPPQFSRTQKGHHRQAGESPAIRQARPKNFPRSARCEPQFASPI